MPRRLRTWTPRALALTALTLMPLGGLAASAQAATPSQPAASVQPAAQPSWCGWKPGNNSHDPGQISYSYVNVRTGQGTQCNIVGGASSGQLVTVRCYTYNGAGEMWYYVDAGVTGWVIANSVYAAWTPVQC